MIGSYMETHGVKFERGFVPIKLERIEEGTPGRIKVWDLLLIFSYWFDVILSFVNGR